jgi:membrane associated rhomboid family serine protease
MSSNRRCREEIISSSQGYIVFPVCDEYRESSSASNAGVNEQGEHSYVYEEEEEYFRGVVGPFKALACELKDTSPIGSYWLTKLLIVVNVLVALFTGGIISLSAEFAYRTYPSSACLVSGGCFLGIILSMFSHANFLHLLGNMIFLYIVGDNIEITLGRVKYLLIYLASGIVGAYTQALITLAFNLGGAHVPIVGASAAISGLIGSYIILYPGSAMCMCLGFRFVYKCFKVRASAYLALWILLQFLYAVIFSFIAVWAHLGGFFTGLVLTYLLADRRKIKELREAIVGDRRRGLSPFREDIVEKSLTPTARGIIVFAATLLLLLILSSAIIVLTSLKGYYIVYLKYDMSCVVPWASWSCGRSFVGVDYEFTPTHPTELKTIDLLAIYNLYNSPVTAVPLSALALFIATIYIMVKGYKEVEVV